MVLHVRHVFECSEENPNLRGGCVKLCSRGEFSSAHPKLKADEYISTDNIQLV